MLFAIELWAAQLDNDLPLPLSGEKGPHPGALDIDIDKFDARPRAVVACHASFWPASLQIDEIGRFN
jgi:hypothetical protein